MSIPRQAAVVRPLLATLVFIAAGCQPSVREDRTITFGPDGRASFQHGRNGVFVTDPVTGAPRQVYELHPDDLATSPPAWDPAGKRMVFVVARSADGRRPEPAGDSPPNGRSYAGVSARYTCWLYDSNAPGREPEKLFEATYGHIGSVAAGMAVAWHPDGRWLDYVDEIAPKRHRVVVFDLESRRSEAAPLPEAEHIALGSGPGGGPRSAVIGGAGAESGLWVAGPEDAGWWLVPDSAPTSAALVDLGHQRPRWSRDRKRLAFVAGAALRVCEIATRQTAVWYRFDSRELLDVIPSSHPSGGLHWHPDGTRVGLIHDTHLGLIGPAGWERDLTPAAAVAFAGWDAAGRRMAFVATEPLPYPTSRSRYDAAFGPALPAPPPCLTSGLWATLLTPNPLARTAVWVADEDGNAARTVVSGVRAAFPHWSPTEPRLSVWLTVEPPYRLADGNWLGMRSGDPAAVIDADTGKLDWLPVRGAEHAQIGHIELRLGRLDEALRRFDEAAAALGPEEKADRMFFRAIALRKAGREADARDALRRFQPPAPVTSAERDRALVALAAALDPRLRVPRGEVVRPVHRFAAEAFVSLEMAAEGIEFLRRELAAAESDADRLSAAVTLGQLLLIAERRTEYAEHAVDVLIPLAERVLPQAGEAAGTAVAVTLLPLAIAEFTRSLPEPLVRRIHDRVTTRRGVEDDSDFVCRLVLRVTARRLGDVALAERVGAGLGTHPARAQWELTDQGEVDLTSLYDLRMRSLLLEWMLVKGLEGSILTER